MMAGKAEWGDEPSSLGVKSNWVAIRSKTFDKYSILFIQT